MNALFSSEPNLTSVIILRKLQGNISGFNTIGMSIQAATKKLSSRPMYTLFLMTIITGTGCFGEFYVCFPKRLLFF